MRLGVGVLLLECIFVNQINKSDIVELATDQNMVEVMAIVTVAICIAYLFNYMISFSDEIKFIKEFNKRKNAKIEENTIGELNGEIK